MAPMTPAQKCDQWGLVVAIVAIFVALYLFTHFTEYGKGNGHVWVRVPGTEAVK